MSAWLNLCLIPWAARNRNSIIIIILLEIELTKFAWCKNKLTNFAKKIFLYLVSELRFENWFDQFNHPVGEKKLNAQNHLKQILYDTTNFRIFLPLVLFLVPQGTRKSSSVKKERVIFCRWDPGHHFDLKYIGSKMRNVVRIQLVRLMSIMWLSK